MEMNKANLNGVLVCKDALWRLSEILLTEKSDLILICWGIGIKDWKLVVYNFVKISFISLRTDLHFYWRLEWNEICIYIVRICGFVLKFV